MVRAQVNPEMIRWALQRAGKPAHALRNRFPRIEAWERGEVMPTLKQLDAFARAVWVPIGYLFLPEPPAEDIPLPDFRSGRAKAERPSPNLLDMIFLCQARQTWYREYARAAGESPKPFVGSLATNTPVEAAAAAIRDALGFDLDARRRCPTWTDALRHFIHQADSAGVLVMVSGVVLNNTHRKLDPAEFRGFAMADPLAPLVFVNGADTKAAQMFTLAHELAHIWLGRSALSDADPREPVDGEVETLCNGVAAELLVPMTVLERELGRDVPVAEEVSRLARRFKVSTLVVLRRMFDAGRLSRSEFHEEYEAELTRIAAQPRGSGGDFYLTQPARASRRFVAALVESTFEGRTSFTEAFRLLGIKKAATLRGLATEVEIAV
jgi:Zn-dependent peptidase ImmA (M78 family)